jgi:hypothetical protein
MFHNVPPRSAVKVERFAGVRFSASGMISLVANTNLT